jgi:hypothetical protein
MKPFVLIALAVVACSAPAGAQQPSVEPSPSWGIVCLVAPYGVPQVMPRNPNYQEPNEVPCTPEFLEIVRHNEELNASGDPQESQP